jgi:hypothetical protein
LERGSERAKSEIEGTMVPFTLKMGLKIRQVSRGGLFELPYGGPKLVRPSAYKANE